MDSKTPPEPGSSPQQREAHLRQSTRALPIALLQAREAVMARFRPMLDRHDISEQQWRVIRMLHEFGEMDATELAGRALILNSSLTRIMRLLEKRKLIVKRRDQQDGRRTLLSLGKKGQTLIAEILPESNTIYQTLETQLDAREINHLLDLLAMTTAKLNTSL